MSSLSRAFQHGWSCGSAGERSLGIPSCPALLVQGVTPVAILLFPNLSWIIYFLPRRSVSLSLPFCFSDQFLLSCLAGTWKESPLFLPELFVTTFAVCSFIHAGTIPFPFPCFPALPWVLSFHTLCSQWATWDPPQVWDVFLRALTRTEWNAWIVPRQLLLFTQTWYFSFPDYFKICDPLWFLIAFPRNSPIVLQHRKGFLAFLLQPEASHFSPFNQFIFRLFIQFVKNILNSNPVL